jgi:thiamine-phosphate pyrophosphorylase
MFPRAVRIYPITDVQLTGLSHAEQVDRLIEGGATLIQLRDKHLSPREFYRQAKGALRVARLHGVRIIINDRVDIALALKADGVHLGQDDMSPQAARSLLGDNALIGFSTHNAEQVRQALNFPVNYIAIGPIFATSSKMDSQPVVGLKGLEHVRSIVGDFPLVAIGGITGQNARAVYDSGADCIALISAVLSDPSQITSKTRQFISAT